MTVTVRNQALGTYTIHLYDFNGLSYLNLQQGNESVPGGGVIGQLGVLDITTTHDFNARIASAEVQLDGIPTGVTFWNQIVIDMGATVGGVVERFMGYVVPYDNELQPIGTTLHCRGRLIRADRRPSGLWAGVDLGNFGQGDTEVNMVTYVLNTCGLGGPPYFTVAGTGRILGTIALQPTQLLAQDRTPFAWGQNESGLAFIERLDEISVGIDAQGTWGAYRTYDTRNGVIMRTLITTIPNTTPVASFTEGLDISRGTWRGDPAAGKTRVRVLGWTMPGGSKPVPGQVTLQRQFPEISSNFYDVPNAIIDPWGDHPGTEFSSPMLELGLYSEVINNRGMSCEEKARQLMASVNCVQEVVQFTTPLDFPLDIGTVINVTSSRLGIPTTTAYWVGAVSCHLDAQGWRMDITGVRSRATAYPGALGS